MESGTELRGDRERKKQCKVGTRKADDLVEEEIKTLVRSENLFSDVKDVVLLLKHRLHLNGVNFSQDVQEK